MREVQHLRGLIIAILFWATMIPWESGAADTPSSIPGVLAEFRQGDTVDYRVLPELSLHVPADAPASPFLATGLFETSWEASVALELRAEMVFQAEAQGRFELWVNGQKILEGQGDSVSTPVSKPVKLEKGANRLQVKGGPLKAHDPFSLRIHWAEKAFQLIPVPAKSLTCTPSAAAQKAIVRLQGRALMAEFRCQRCHETGVTADEHAMLELSMEGPSLAGIGSRRNVAWMADWILDPQAVRPGSHTHMPKMFVGVDAKEKAEAVAAYLGSLKETTAAALKEPAPWTSLTPPPAEVAGEEPKPLFEKLHCQACHVAGESTEPLGERISLLKVNHKFPSGRLAEFLRQPDLHYKFIRMPNFRLTKAEADDLAAYVSGKASAAPAAGADPDPKLVEKGMALTAEMGCARCHSGLPKAAGAQAPVVAPAWSALTSAVSKAADAASLRGCLAENETGAGKAPRFQFSATQREAFRAFVGHTASVESIQRHVADESAMRLASALQCVNCHGVIENIPAFEVLGGKLKPDWMRLFIAGRIPYKPRQEKHPRGEPWMAARMPALPAYASVLAEGLAAAHGYGSVTHEDTKVDESLAKVGQQLVGKVQGFSCVSCHGANSLPAQDVFEVEGINFAQSAERLQLDYYRRWMRAPMLVDPSTKMPGYFDEEGKSPLGEILGGDAAKQIDAIWEYLKQGPKMGLPKLVE